MFMPHLIPYAIKILPVIEFQFVIYMYYKTVCYISLETLVRLNSDDVISSQ